MEDSGELDISAIFGGGGTASDINPFDAPAAQTERPAEPTEQAKPEAPAAPAPQPVPAPNPQPVPRAQTQNPAPAAEPVNPISVAIDKQETQVAQAAAKSLFEKAPIFSYGSAKDEITDGAMTFEELRIAKSDDFPELGEGKRVSWSVEYGKVTKTISDPKGATIQSVKEEIERSKAFLDGLKKAKDKSPDCLVKPRVTAQSKGIAAYKGVFTSLEEARTSDKAICLFPSGDGRVYELRKTELGELIAPKDNVIEFPSVRAGFTPALPLIPVSLLSQIISFFRCYMNNAAEFEALVHILWDKEQEKFVVHVPPQEVSKARVNADLSRDELDETRYLPYMDIHSHNSMAAKFSPVDDQDERATRLYAVLGHLDQFFPEITVRMSCGGTYCELDPALVFEGLGEVFPREWRDNVKIGESRKEAKLRLREVLESDEFWGGRP
jgi:PRTRC genetic system protein A